MFYKPDDVQKVVEMLIAKGEDERQKARRVYNKERRSV
jgi:hypothetical protein